MMFKTFFHEESRELKLYSKSDISDINFLIHSAEFIAEKAKDFIQIEEITIYIEDDYEEEFNDLNFDEFYNHLERLNFTKTDKIFFEMFDEIEDEELDDPNYDGEEEVRKIGNAKFRAKFGKLKTVRILPDYYSSHNEYIDLLKKMVLLVNQDFHIGQIKGNTNSNQINLEFAFSGKPFSIAINNIGRFLNLNFFNDFNEIIAQNSHKTKFVEISPNGKNSNENEIYITYVNQIMLSKLKENGFASNG